MKTVEIFDLKSHVRDLVFNIKQFQKNYQIQTGITLGENDAARLWIEKNYNKWFQARLSK